MLVLAVWDTKLARAAAAPANSTTALNITIEKNPQAGCEAAVVSSSDELKRAEYTKALQSKCCSSVQYFLCSIMEDHPQQPLNRLEDADFSHQEISEPQRKKRCIRFASDLSSEDPLLIGDSGFGDLPKFEEHGDLEVSTYFTSDGVATQLFEDTGHPLCGSIRATSIDSLSLHTDLSDVQDQEEEGDGEEEVEEGSPPTEDGGFEPFAEGNTQSNFSASDPCCSSASSSRSSSSSSNHESSFSSVDDDCDFSFLFNHKEVAANPMRAAMLQRFLSQYRSNPNDSHLQHLLSLILSGPEFSQRRNRLRHVSTIQDAARLLRCSKRVMVLTGAGISVSCGIPDFRSKDGLYSRVAKVFPELRDPQSVFDIRLFRRDPRPFFLTAKELYPGQFEPSLSHRFIRKLEQRGQLLRNYSQNIDTLETIAGIERVTMCHGSFATATCIRCKHKVSADDIKEKVLAGEVPFCTVCSNEEEWSKIKFPLGQPSASSSQQQDGAPPRRSSLDDDDDDDNYFFPDPDPLPPVVKPDIVFFGEDLPDEFHANLTLDKPHCDLLVVIGSSLRVRPVSLIPGMIPAEVPQILINREPLPQVQFDIELYGNSDAVIAQLSRLMGPDFGELASPEPHEEICKLIKEGVEEPSTEVSEPKSEHDVEALKACWEPKTTHNLADKLPPKSYLKWRPHQYVFEGAEVLYDPDDDDDDDEDEEDDDSSEDEDEASLGLEACDNSAKRELVTDIIRNETATEEANVSQPSNVGVSVGDDQVVEKN